MVGMYRTDYKIEPGEIIVSAVTTTTIASLAVTTTKIALSAVTSAQLGVGAVYTSAIQDAAVTSTQIVNSAITSDKYAQSSIGQDKLMAGIISATFLSTGPLTLDNLIALGSYSLSADPGGVTMAHGLLTAPTAAWATPWAADIMVAYGRRVALKGMDATNVTFIVCSAAPVASNEATLVASLTGTMPAATFVWGAHL